MRLWYSPNIQWIWSNWAEAVRSQVDRKLKIFYFFFKALQLCWDCDPRWIQNQLHPEQFPVPEVPSWPAWLGWVPPLAFCRCAELWGHKSFTLRDEGEIMQLLWNSAQQVVSCLIFLCRNHVPQSQLRCTQSPTVGPQRKHAKEAQTSHISELRPLNVMTQLQKASRIWSRAWMRNSKSKLSEGVCLLTIFVHAANKGGKCPAFRDAFCLTLSVSSFWIAKVKWTQ